MNSTLINRRTLLAGALAGVGVGAGQSFAAQSRTVDPEETIKLQKNHAARVAERGRKTYYDAKRFDLTDLPEYRAQASVSGKLRVWGLNYFTDGKLLQYWEESCPPGAQSTRDVAIRAESPGPGRCRA